MELDHVFVFIEPDGPELAYLRSLGLIETYRRRHPGQGTENICFCFENIFLECLWIGSVAEATSDLIVRTGLYDRSQWRTRETSPFGLAWRESAANPPIDIAKWSFKPPYLPPGMSIDVAIESDDPRQPMMFKSPGSVPPAKWPIDKRGVLQKPAGFGEVLSVVLHWPKHAPPTPGLTAFAAATIVDLVPAKDDTASISLFVERFSSSTPLQISLPRLV